MADVIATQEDMAEIMVLMARLGLPADVQGALVHGDNRGTLPPRVLEQALAPVLARHRHQAMIEGARVGLEAALSTCANYRAFTGDQPLWPDEPGTSISCLSPADIIRRHLEGEG